MRITNLIALALIACAAVPTLPVAAKDLKLDLKFNDRVKLERSAKLCVPPARWAEVCVKWDKPAEGMLFGKCLATKMECQTPPVVH